MRHMLYICSVRCLHSDFLSNNRTMFKRWVCDEKVTVCSVYIKIEIRQKCVISLYKNNKYVKLVPAND